MNEITGRWVYFERGSIGKESGGRLRPAARLSKFEGGTSRDRTKRETLALVLTPYSSAIHIGCIVGKP